MAKRSCPFDSNLRQTKMRIRESDVNKTCPGNMKDVYGMRMRQFVCKHMHLNMHCSRENTQ